MIISGTSGAKTPPGPPTTMRKSPSRTSLQALQSRFPPVEGHRTASARILWGKRSKKALAIRLSGKRISVRFPSSNRRT